MGHSPSDINHSRPDPRLAALLADYPAELFDDGLYRSIAWAEQYAACLVADVLAALGIADPPADAAELSACARSQGLVDAFQPTLAWLAAFHRRSAASGTPRQSRPALYAAGVAIDPANARTAALFDAAAAAYPRVARGEASGEDLLLGGAATTLWLDYFNNANALYAVNNHVAAIAATRRIGGRAMPRILEVGAGAGSGTEALLDRLAAVAGGRLRLGAYVASEPSPFFRRRGQRRLAGRSPALSFRAVDIDHPWPAQGIEPCSFDLVFAVNVLHVAGDLPFTLDQARRSLAAGGWLVAGECLRPFPAFPVSIEFVFGLFKGFSKVHPIPGTAPEAGFLTPEAWQVALAGAGFDTVEITPDHHRIRDVLPQFVVGAVCARTGGGDG
jgi:SAM-dependent methyltransferase